jgi:hypothetical protein
MNKKRVDTHVDTPVDTHVDTVCVDQGMLKKHANLYAYIVDTETFDRVALSWYMASGKFDKNSLGRWGGDIQRYKAQLIRASIDNTVVFVPVGDIRSPEHAEDLRGHLLLFCSRREGAVRVLAVGIITRKPMPRPDEYMSAAPYLLPVHVVCTSCTVELSLEQLCGTRTPISASDFLPTHVYKLCYDVCETIQVDRPVSVEHEYDRHVVFAHGYAAYLRELRAVETPVQELERDRRRRLSALFFHLSKQKGILFPPTRRHGQKKHKTSFEHVMKLHRKYEMLFDKLLGAMA